MAGKARAALIWRIGRVQRGRPPLAPLLAPEPRRQRAPAVAQDRAWPPDACFFHASQDLRPVALCVHATKQLAHAACLRLLRVRTGPPLLR